MGEEWKHKDEWTIRRTGFCVVVSRHEVEPDSVTQRGPNRWAIYVYVYPSHPMFPKLGDKSGIFGDPQNEIPFHCGCSYYKAHRGDEGDITSYQIGCDYDHLYDECFSLDYTKDQAAVQFSDAAGIIKYMETFK